MSKKLVAILLASALTAGQAFAANTDASSAQKAPAQGPLAPGAAAGVKQAQDMHFDEETGLWVLGGVALVGGVILLSQSNNNNGGKSGSSTPTTP